MTQLRDLENTHHEKVTEIAVDLLERFVKKQLDEEPHEDLRVVSVLGSAVYTSYYASTYSVSHLCFLHVACMVF